MTTSHPREERGQAGEGFVLVPEEATEAMWQAGREADEHPGDSYSAIYRAMIAAAPVTGTEGTGRDFELMLARIIHRHGKGLDITDTIAGARDLLARKGSLSPLREETTAPQPAGAERVDLGEMERLSKAASPGPWGVEDTVRAVWVGPIRADGKKVAQIIYGVPDLADYREVCTARIRADAGLIVALVNAYRSGHLVPASLPAALGSGEGTAGASFQERNAAWMAEAFDGDPTDLPERVARFGEEALELQQALGQSREDAHRLVDYVYSRPIGYADKEMGGTLTTLACLAVALGIDMAACGEDELARVSTPAFIAKLRGKRATRHGRGPLPGFSAPGTSEPHPQSPSLSEVEEEKALLAGALRDIIACADDHKLYASSGVMGAAVASMTDLRKRTDRAMANARAALATLTASQEQDGEVRHG